VKPLDSNLQCPSCHHPLRPTVLGCERCNIRLEGPFQLNEFATLSPEDLHFLRIFVQAEGRIREMESALGLSYPTIRARITALKNRLAGETSPPAAKPALAAKPERESKAGQILEALRQGTISFDEAMRRLKTD
jgi:hypothetical protein